MVERRSPTCAKTAKTEEEARGAIVGRNRSSGGAAGRGCQCTLWLCMPGSEAITGQASRWPGRAMEGVSKRGAAQVGQPVDLETSLTTIITRV